MIKNFFFFVKSEINREVYKETTEKNAPVFGIRKRPGFLKFNPKAEVPYQELAKNIWRI